MKILIGGDFAIYNRGIEALKNEKIFTEEVVQLLRNSDISIINLEMPIANDDNFKISKIGPNLKTSPDILPYLKKCGINLVTLANNHFYDYGEHGVNLTISELIKNHIDYIGGGRTPEEYKQIQYYNIDNVKLAILNYCESEFSVNKFIGSNPINPINVFYDVNEAKQKADYIIAITHGGHERYDLPSPRMQQLFRYFIDIGINVVVNHHQHCFSGYEEYKNGYIFYGLGNLFFDNKEQKETKTPWNEGYLLQLDINNKSSFSFKLFPYEQCLKNRLPVTLLKDNHLFNTKINRLNSIITIVR